MAAKIIKIPAYAAPVKVNGEPVDKINVLGSAHNAAVQDAMWNMLF